MKPVQSSVGVTQHLQTSTQAHFLPSPLPGCRLCGQRPEKRRARTVGAIHRSVFVSTPPSLYLAAPRNVISSSSTRSVCAPLGLTVSLGDAGCRQLTLLGNFEICTIFSLQNNAKSFRDLFSLFLLIYLYRLFRRIRRRRNASGGHIA